MIQSIVGLQNSGKTLYMTYLGFLQFLEGKRVFSNLKLNFPHFLINRDYLFWLGLEQISIKNACFLLDELWIWLDCRKSQENTIATYFFLQSAKDDMYIFLTAQNNEQNERRLRQNLHRLTECSRILYINGKKYKVSDEDRYLTVKKGYPPNSKDLLYIKAKNYKIISKSIFNDLKKENTEYIKGSLIYPLYDTEQKQNVKRKSFIINK